MGFRALTETVGLCFTSSSSRLCKGIRDGRIDHCILPLGHSMKKVYSGASLSVGLASVFFSMRGC